MDPVPRFTVLVRANSNLLDGTGLSGIGGIHRHQGDLVSLLLFSSERRKIGRKYIVVCWIECRLQVDAIGSHSDCYMTTRIS
jgi:hypothetical protein